MTCFPTGLSWTLFSACVVAAAAGCGGGSSSPAGVLTGGSGGMAGSDGGKEAGADVGPDVSQLPESGDTGGTGGASSDACAKPCGIDTCCEATDECSLVSNKCVPRRKLGVVYGLYGPNQASPATQLAATKSSVARVYLSWLEADPGDTHADYAWEKADQHIATIYAGGVDEALVVIGGAGEREWEKDFPATMNRYLDYVGALVGRYKDRVRKWQFMAEVNHASKPGSDGKLPMTLEHYVLLHNAAYEKVKSLDPQSQVANAAITVINDKAVWTNSIRGIDWLHEAISLGMKVDAVAVHPYSTSGTGGTYPPDKESMKGWNNFRDLDLVVQLLSSLGPVWESKPVWVTECGWTTLKHQMLADGGCAPNPCLQTTDPGVCLASVSEEQVEDTQAQYTDRSIQMLRDNYPSVQLATLYFLADRTVSSLQQCVGWGLFRLDGSSKPAQDRFKAYNGRL